PYCHLLVPRALLETRPYFLSILGTPACGKSYYLAALTWGLRHLLPGNFALDFADVDPVFNQPLTANEEALFLNPRANGYHYLSTLIGKTKLQGEQYDTVSFGNQVITYPRPYIFSLRPLPPHRLHGQDDRAALTLCVYD